MCYYYLYVSFIYVSLLFVCVWYVSLLFVCVINMVCVIDVCVISMVCVIYFVVGFKKKDVAMRDTEDYE